jgi:hypothetical protein
MGVGREIFQEQFGIEETKDRMIGLQIMLYQLPSLGVLDLDSRPATDLSIRQPRIWLGGISCDHPLV